MTQNHIPTYQPGDRLGGYRVEQVVDLPTFEAEYIQLRHEKTGARHIHIRNPDTENTFGVVLKTVPADSTGVAHILEHTALCGSAKYPVRDPFFSMLKRSLSTFMNAFTASDWTMYPFSTQNRQDFYNLMDVYLDAVFFPRLDEMSFKQEGHRLEPADDNPDRLEFKGVVYNEMKGAMSSPSQVMGQSLLTALYPDTTYRYNSGGDPSEIPLLTHEHLVNFHRHHYHPSNAYFYTYGDLELADHLAFIQGRILDRFDAIDPQTEVPAQPRWDQPRQAQFYYALGGEDTIDRKHQVCLGWLGPDIRETFDVLVMALLEQILLGNPASPLRRALMDAGLGSALSDGTGFQADNRDTLFCAGLKDVSADDADRIEDIITSVLTDLKTNGVDPELVEAAIHQLEFHRKEVKNTPFPNGIRQLLTLCSTWLHGGDPARILNIDDDLDRLHEAIAGGGFFEEQIGRTLLDNPHRVRLVLSPDPEMDTRMRQREEAALKEIRDRLDAPDMTRVMEDTLLLRQRQETAEDVSRLPTLQVEDIPPMVPSVSETRRLSDAPISVYEQPTAGIFYFSSVFGAGNIDADLVPLVPLFCYVLPKIGTTRRRYDEMARLIDLHTGGLGLSANARTAYDDDGGCLPLVMFNAKCLDRNIDKTFAILEEIFDHHDFSDHDQLRRLTLEFRAAHEAAVIQSGHRFAMSLAARGLTGAAGLGELWTGVHHFQHIKSVASSLEDDAEAVAGLADKLSRIGRSLFDRENVRTAVIGDADATAAGADAAAAMLAGLGETAGGGFRPPAIDLPSQMPREGWHTASAVSFVAGVINTERLTHPDAAALAVIAKMMRSLYLHREIREKGGAYGGFAVYNPEDGLFGFASYRDPHILSTLAAFDGACDFITAGSFRDDDIREAVLQVCSDIDKPDPPGPAARKAFYRDIMGLDDETRNRFKARVLDMAREQVINTAHTYFSPPSPVRNIAVISGFERLQTANQRLGKSPLSIQKI